MVAKIPLYYMIAENNCRLEKVLLLFLPLCKNILGFFVDSLIWQIPWLQLRTGGSLCLEQLFSFTLTI